MRGLLSDGDDSWITLLCIQARPHNPDSAVTAGYLDEVVEGDKLMETALARATALGEFSGEAYATVKRRRSWLTVSADDYVSA